MTEAIRGEGATLHDAAGERFVDELEPRDAVAKAIHKLLVETGAPAVYLDMTAIDPGALPERRRGPARGRRWIRRPSGSPSPPRATT